MRPRLLQLYVCGSALQEVFPPHWELEDASSPTSLGLIFIIGR